MKNLSNFFDSALTRSEMKSIKGGGCGSTCCYNGRCEQSAGYGTSTYEKAHSAATSCATTGPGYKGYWCCANC